MEDDTIENDILERAEDDIITETGLDHQEELSLWVEAVGGHKKGRIYGLGSHSSVVYPLNYKAGSSKASTSDYSNTPNFEKAIQHEINKRIGDIRAIV